MKKKTSAPFNLILLGEPAAGKETQSARLARRYGLYDFDMGRELRRIQNDPAIERRWHLRAVLASGKITPTPLARSILRNTVARVPKSRGILFDGHPKMLGEAKLLARDLARRKRSDPLVIYLHIPVAETVKRAAKRRRPEDTLAALRVRAQYYRIHVRAAVGFYKKRYRFVRVSGLGTRTTVFARLVKVIDAWRR